MRQRQDGHRTERLRPMRWDRQATHLPRRQSTGTWCREPPCIRRTLARYGDYRCNKRRKNGAPGASPRNSVAVVLRRDDRKNTMKNTFTILFSPEAIAAMAADVLTRSSLEATRDDRSEER